MMDKIKKNMVFYLLLLIDFYIVPWFIKNTGSAMIVMLVIIPLICLITSVFYVIRNGFKFRFLSFKNWELFNWFYNVLWYRCRWKNIDFRRVKNLKVYFDNNAISLTTDINEIEEWQGGDIVVFKKHIGIISDKRNRKGICFVIHHANPYQIYYEEDILEHRDDIIGHYRIS